ncbi:acyl-CoA desaturase, partial [Acinetobacter nosocomialis]
TGITDWLQYPDLIWLDRFSLPVVILTALAFYGLGSWLAQRFPELGTNGFQLLVWGFVISTVLLTLATLCINSIAKRYGSREFNTADD